MVTFIFVINPNLTNVEPLIAGGWQAQFFLRCHAMVEAIARGYLPESATDLPPGSEVSQIVEDPTDWRLYFEVSIPDEAERFVALLRNSGFTGDEE